MSDNDVFAKILEERETPELLPQKKIISITFPRTAVGYIDEQGNAVRGSFNEQISLLEKKFMGYITSTTNEKDETIYTIEPTTLALQQLTALKPLIQAHGGVITGI